MVFSFYTNFSKAQSDFLSKRVSNPSIICNKKQTKNDEKNIMCL